MKVKIKRFDKSLPLPKYQTAGAAAFDLYLRNNEVIAPREIKLLPANFALKMPKGYFLLIEGRSSTPRKYGLLVITGVGDEDYCGDEDQYLIQVLNLTDKKVFVSKGARIAQGMLIKVAKADFVEVKKLVGGKRLMDFDGPYGVPIKSRGGFGSTGY
jgi:dUTP pyrophosphatase